jgi:hypothetical protein
MTGIVGVMVGLMIENTIEMKTIDFRKIEVSDIEGKKVILDVSKTLGNVIYNNTPDLGELDFAQELYKKGEVEVDEEKAEMIRRYVEVGKFFAYVKKGIDKVLDEVK